jgi:ATP-dependent Lhr-like helicase
MYEGDSPMAERRAQALTLDRRMLAELVGSDELRELLDPAALAALEAELQFLDEDRWARSVDAAHDLLRRLGDLSVDELRARAVDDFSAQLVRERRAAVVRVAGQERLIAAEDAGRYRDALGVQPPPGLPEVFLEPVEDALVQLVRRWARTHGPFVSEEPAARFGLDVVRLDELLPELDTVVRGEFRPDGTEREWCDNEVLRLLRQRSLAALRREVEPTEVEALARFLPAWQADRSEARALHRAYEVDTQLQGVPIPASVLERDVLSARVHDYAPRLLDELLAAGELMWVGAGPIGRDDGRVRLLLRADAPLLLQKLGLGSGERPDDKEHDRIRDVLSTRGACFFRELTGGNATDDESLDALWDLVWAGEVTNDSFAAVRALSAKRRAGGKARGGRPRLGSLSALGPPRAQGRWSLVASAVGDADPTRAAHLLAGVLLERHGVLTREAVRGEGVPGGFAAVYPVLRAMEEAGRIRRGYFVAGLGGAQFALPGAVDRLRGFRDPPRPAKATLLAATDPANPYGVALPWPVKGPQRAAGAHVVLIDGEAALYVEKGGRGLVALRPFDGSWEALAVATLGGLLAEGRFKRISVDRCPPELEPHLREAGFVSTPKGLVRYA